MDEQRLQQVWEKARSSIHRDPGRWRQDPCGAWMHRDQYGREDSDYGWKVLGVAGDGDGRPADLQAFHHRNGLHVDHSLRCVVTADHADLAPGTRAFRPRGTTGPRPALAARAPERRPQGGGVRHER